jgi:hypothetical protein
MAGKATDHTDRDFVAVHIPKALFERVQTYCAEKNITIDEFFIDAIGEQLQRSYKEKRRRPRL